MDSALSVFFPFWQIISQGAAWLVPTLAVTLLLDSAVLMALLLILRPRRAARRSADAGNIWRRTFSLPPISPPHLPPVDFFTSP